VCGEYGSKRRRPHYHIILFNSDELSIAKAWCNNDRVPIGDVHFGEVSGASIAYTIKYINKGQWKPDHKNDDRYPEFSNMSKGLGSNFLSEDIVKFHQDNPERAYLTVADGIKIPIPRYYKNKIFKTELPPTAKNEWLIKNHPSILTHLEENKILLKQQNEAVKKIVAEQPPLEMTDRELHESRKNAIENFKRKHLERGDL